MCYYGYHISSRIQTYFHLDIGTHVWYCFGSSGFLMLMWNARCITHACEQAGMLGKGQVLKVKCLMIVWLAIKNMGKSINSACQQKVFFIFFGCVCVWEGGGVLKNIATNIF